MAMVAVLLACASAACGQSLSARLAAFNSPEDTTRMRAFYEVVELANEGQAPTDNFLVSTERWARFAGQRDEVAIASIRLLERENRRVFREGGSDSDAYSNYYANLIGHVAALRDTHAVAALVGAITTGGMATEGLAVLGEAALPAVEHAAASPDIQTRGAAFHTLGRIATALHPKLKPVNRSRIKALLIDGLSDAWAGNRIAAMNSLAAFRDSTIVALVRALAATDTFRVGSGSSVRFPVRDAARSWLVRSP